MRAKLCRQLPTVDLPRFWTVEFRLREGLATRDEVVDWVAYSRGLVRRAVNQMAEEEVAAAVAMGEEAPRGDYQQREALVDCGRSVTKEIKWSNLDGFEEPGLGGFNLAEEDEDEDEEEDEDVGEDVGEDEEN